MVSDFPELLWTKTVYFCMISQILTIFQRYLNSDLQETDKKINWYLVSTYGFQKITKYQTLIDVKKLTFSKFCIPIAVCYLLVPFRFSFVQVYSLILLGCVIYHRYMGENQSLIASFIECLDPKKNKIFRYGCLFALP